LVNRQEGVGFALKVGKPLFSVCSVVHHFVRKNNRRGAEHTEVAQRRSRVNNFWGKAEGVMIQFELKEGLERVMSITHSLNKVFYAEPKAKP
jgi:hypothetical protein